MQKRIKLTVAACLIMLLTGAVATAQNGSNSPYTRYGYGDLANRSFGAGRSMGGVGVGLRSSKQINPLNPASYACMDSMTFMFDFGASAQLSWFSDGVSNQRDLNGNVEYMAMQFPVFKIAAMSIGLLPYSHVGYNFGEVKTENGVTYSETYEGTGGLNQLYAGLSVNLWKKRLSLGANVNYLFGNITHASTSSYSSENPTSVRSAEQAIISSAGFDFGLQYVQPISKTESLTAGLTYTPALKLGNRTYQSISSTESVIDTVHGLTYNLPAGYGLGLSYEKENKLLIAADVTFQQWDAVKFADRADEFRNRTKIAAGAELIPNLFSRPYFNRVRYRAGMSYTDSYVKVMGKGYSELSATVGAGFPISDARSYVNVSFEYVNIKPEVKTMIAENYFRMTVSYTFNEFWFFKKKMD